MGKVNKREGGGERVKGGPLWPRVANPSQISSRRRETPWESFFFFFFEKTSWIFCFLL